MRKDNNVWKFWEKSLWPTLTVGSSSNEMSDDWEGKLEEAEGALDRIFYQESKRIPVDYKSDWCVLS